MFNDVLYVFFLSLKERNRAERRSFLADLLRDGAPPRRHRAGPGGDAQGAREGAAAAGEGGEAGRLAAGEGVGGPRRGARRAEAAV